MCVCVCVCVVGVFEFYVFLTLLTLISTAEYSTLIAINSVNIYDRIDIVNRFEGIMNNVLIGFLPHKWNSKSFFGVDHGIPGYVLIVILEKRLQSIISNVTSNLTSFSCTWKK